MFTGKRVMTTDETKKGLSWDDWARILGRDLATLDVDEIVTADMRLGAIRRRLVREERAAARADAAHRRRFEFHRTNGDKLKVGTPLKDEASHDNQKQNRSSKWPPVIFGAPWVGPPAALISELDGDQMPPIVSLPPGNSKSAPKLHSSVPA
jgi:hypothetical protein